MKAAVVQPRPMPFAFATLTLLAGPATALRPMMQPRTSSPVCRATPDPQSRSAALKSAIEPVMNAESGITTTFEISGVHSLGGASAEVPPWRPTAKAVAAASLKTAKTESHLMPGPVLLSWFAAVLTLTLQYLITNWVVLGHDTKAFWHFLESLLPPNLMYFLGQGTTAEYLALYSFLWVYIVSSSFILMPGLFPVQEGDAGAKKVPFRRRASFLRQHQLTPLDFSYVALNTLCMPGFFYHVFCLLRSWGGIDMCKSLLLLDDKAEGVLGPLATMADPMAAPLDDISAAVWNYMHMSSEVISLPGALGSLAVYMVTYEFFYYWWHRAMHEVSSASHERAHSAKRPHCHVIRPHVQPCSRLHTCTLHRHAQVPALYKWVHKHHHQQTYPDRPALDTFNTGCVESQIGLYMQLATLFTCGTLGVANVPAGLWFITLAGWLSVLEHDKFERALPFNLWKADEHHMHHAFVKCNYSPYTVFWDQAFGTHKAPEDFPPVVQTAEAEAKTEAEPASRGATRVVDDGKSTTAA